MKKLKNIISMKTLYKTLKIAAGLFIVAALASSCVPDQESMGGNGQTIVRLVTPSADGYYMFAISASSVSQTVMALDIRKNSANASELNSETTVTLQFDNADTTMLKAYNQTYETNFVPFPAGTYTSSPVITSNKIILVFAPGDLAKQVSFTIPNATALDMSNAYGFAILASVTGTGTWSGTTNDTILVQIMPKNKYDGIYTLKGLHNRSPYNFPYMQTMELRTTGASSVAYFWPAPDGPDDYGHPIGTGPDIVNDVSWYGNGVAPVIVFDPLTDLVSNVYNSSPAPPITKWSSGSGSNANMYDPATKTIYVSWNYNANPLRVFTDTLYYKSPR
jgi:hypothetical protein